MIPKHSYKFARLFCLYSLLILKHYPVQESLLFSYSSSQEAAAIQESTNLSQVFSYIKKKIKTKNPPNPPNQQKTQ